MDLWSVCMCARECVVVLPLQTTKCVKVYVYVCMEWKFCVLFWFYGNLCFAQSKNQIKFYFRRFSFANGNGKRVEPIQLYGNMVDYHLRTNVCCACTIYIYISFYVYKISNSIASFFLSQSLMCVCVCVSLNWISIYNTIPSQTFTLQYILNASKQCGGDSDDNDEDNDIDGCLNSTKKVSICCVCGCVWYEFISKGEINHSYFHYVSVVLILAMRVTFYAHTHHNNVFLRIVANVFVFILQLFASSSLFFFFKRKENHHYTYCMFTNYSLCETEKWNWNRQAGKQAKKYHMILY